MVEYYDANKEHAIELYGDIRNWDVSKVTTWRRCLKIY